MGNTVSIKRRILIWGGGALGLIVIAGCAGWYVYLQHLNNNIAKVNIGEDNPATTDGPINILLIGNDARPDSANVSHGDKRNVGHADATLLVHVSKDRSNATVMSIPRDLITDIPDCPTKQPDGSTKMIPGEQNVRFNFSLGQKGRDPGCTMRTAEHITGLNITHFMMADFDAIETLSTAIGGVDVCAERPIHDARSHLNLPAGHSVVEGEQALAFVRTRFSVGFGSDLSRIQLQQQFLSSTIRKLKSSILTDPAKLLDLAEVATNALTVDSGIGSVAKLMALARDLGQVDTKNITFLTVPVRENPQDRKATVILDTANASPLFKMVQADKSMMKTGALAAFSSFLSSFFAAPDDVQRINANEKLCAS